jgi:hypothetical protein
MFQDNGERRDTIIAIAIAVVACAGLYWIRREAPPKPVRDNANLAVFKLTDPLPEAHDGVREVMDSMHRCASDGKATFSSRECEAADSASESGKDAR